MGIIVNNDRNIYHIDQVSHITDTLLISDGDKWTGDSDSKENWDIAYSERREWDGSSTNLNATTGRSSLALNNHDHINVSSVDDITNGNSGYRADVDSLHTNDLGDGQMYVEGSYIDANDTIRIGEGVAGGQDAQDAVFGKTVTATTFTGTATQAQYADLAEKFTIDPNTEVGTVVKVLKDSDYEVGKTEQDLDDSIGVVSDNPAYLMNKDSKGKAIALVGRVPISIYGSISKGERIVPTLNGKCRKANDDEKIYSIGYALENKESDSPQLVECVLK